MYNALSILFFSLSLFGMNSCSDAPTSLTTAAPAPRATATVAQPLAIVRASSLRYKVRKCPCKCSITPN
jgi:hypothetical protein